MAKRKLSAVIGKYDPRGSKVSKMTGLKSYPFIMQYAKDEANGLDKDIGRGFAFWRFPKFRKTIG